MSTPPANEDFVYIPVSGKVSYIEAESVCRDSSVFIFGKYKKPPKQPIAITGVWTDRHGYKHPRLCDGTLLPSSVFSADNLTVYHPIPKQMRFPELMVWFDEALSMYKGKRNVLISYTSVSESPVTVEFATSIALVQSDLDLYFYEGVLTYQRAAVCPKAGLPEWWE